MHVQFFSYTTFFSVCCFNAEGLEIIRPSNNTMWLSTQYRIQNVWKLHHYLYHTDRAAHKRELRITNVAVEIKSQSSCSSSSILGSKSDKHHEWVKASLFSFWDFCLGFFLSFFFAVFVSYPSLSSTACWNH